MLILNRTAERHENGTYHSSDDIRGTDGLSTDSAYANSASPRSPPLALDVTVVGSSWAGLWMLYELKQLGVNVRLIEMQGDVGGVWNSHRYPGCRVDTEVPFYEFSKLELWKNWTWSENFPSRAEVQRYMSYACDALDLRSLIIFHTYVTAAHWNDAEKSWYIYTKDGLLCTTQFFIPTCGYSSIPYYPQYKGFGTFPNAHHSSRFPEDLDCTGKRVGIIGTGASGLQIIEALAPQVAHLTVFQRTPNLATPCRQKCFSPKHVTALKADYPRLFAARLSHNGVDNLSEPKRTFEVSTDERETFWQGLWARGGLSFWFRNYKDMMTDANANRAAYDFWRAQTLKRIDDTAIAAILAPEQPPHAFGTKRPSLETDYFEAFNAPHVKLINLRSDPIAAETPTGITCTRSGHHELDVLIYATGFDFFEASLLRLDIRGRNGLELRKKWPVAEGDSGVWTYLGLCTHGFPNMFFPMGPQGPSALGLTPQMAEIQGAYVARIIAYMRDNGLKVVQPKIEAEMQWKGEVQRAAAATLYPTAESWYMGVNIPGRMREARCYFGGVDTYVTHLENAWQTGWKGFAFE